LNEDPTASSLRTRPSLLGRLSNTGDSVAWGEFHGLYRKLVYGLCRRSGLSHEESEEVAQDVFARVAETIGNFESDPAKGTFRGWLMNLTRWRVADKFRERPKGMAPANPRLPETGDGTSTIDRLPDSVDADEAWELEWRGTVLAAAMDRMARKSKPKHFQVLDLCRSQNWSVIRISRELKMNVASVYTIRQRLMKQLKEEVERLRSQLG
jgi:RNA polymerase sigma factor (sigma-70 family)